MQLDETGSKIVDFKMPSNFRQATVDLSFAKKKNFLRNAIIKVSGKSEVIQIPYKTRRFG